MIRPVNGAAPVGSGRGAPKEAGGFSVGRSGAPAAAPLVASVQSIGLDGMLSLQEAPEDVADREARRHGHEMLEALGELQRMLLGVRAGDIARLARLAADVPQAHNPALREAVAAIALRARVEAARLEMAKEAVTRGDAR